MNEFDALYQQAHEAGLEAMAKCTPTPMVVAQHKSPLNDNSPIVKGGYVPQGVCGFAWVKIRPATSALARHWKKQGYATTDSYNGGLSVWVGEGGQSYELKQAYASAFASVLRGAGYDAWADSRLD